MPFIDWHYTMVKPDKISEWNRQYRRGVVRFIVFLVRTKNKSKIKNDD